MSGLPFLLTPLILSATSIFYKIPFYDSVGGFQYKDAGAWSACIKALALKSEFLSGSGDWCLRRPLFPEIASLIYRVYNSMPFVNLVFALFFGVSLYALFVQISKLLPLLGSVIICSGTLFYWFIFCCAQVLTESLAISISVYGLVLFLKAKSSENFKYVYLSITLIGLSQQIRPGNIFLPLVPICLIFGINIKNRFAPILISLFFFLLPFLITALLRIILHKPEYSNAGNAWATLYGLANNNSSWQSAYTVAGIPAGATDSQISEVIKAATLDSIQSNIFALPISIGKNLLDMLVFHFPFISPVSILNAPFSIAMNSILLTWLIVRTASRVNSNSISKSELSLIIFIAITSLISYAIAWKSEPARALMPTIPFLFFVFLFAIQGESARHERRATKSSTVERFSFYTNFREAASSIGLVLAVYTFSFSSHVLSPFEPSIDTKSCKDGTFNFILNSTTATNIESIKTFSVYSWGKDLPKLKSGQLIQGMGLSDGKIISVNAFSKKVLDRKELVDYCFRYVTPGKYLGGFSDSGVKIIVKSNS